MSMTVKEAIDWARQVDTKMAKHTGVNAAVVTLAEEVERLALVVSGMRTTYDEVPLAIEMAVWFTHENELQEGTVEVIRFGDYWAEVEVRTGYGEHIRLDAGDCFSTQEAAIEGKLPTTGGPP